MSESFYLNNRGCEAFHSFIERCMDPMVPASIHSIPQKYNLPGRMWKSAFMLLFERLRSALPDPESRETSSVGTVDSNANGEPSTFGSVLEHIVDFVYYAYTFYTQLLEQQSLQAFRGTWIEHLGDIARYRMSIADISSRVPSVPIEVKSNTSGQSLRNLLEGTDCNATSIGEGQRDVDHDRNPRKQLITRKDRKKGFPGIPAKLPEDLELADTPGNSIGAAALDDWELVEHDIWRTVAQDWYFLGLNETPGTGRLHHRLAMMAQEDELRALYHYSKR